MANTSTDVRTSRSHTEEQAGRNLTRREDPRSWQRFEHFGGFANPFEFMERMTDEMDRWFDRVRRDVGMPRLFTSPLTSPRGLFHSSGRNGIWAPRIEAAQKGDTFTVRADLPGLRKHDVEVDLTDEALTIRGERREEHQEDSSGYWHSEREYGHFQRTIPLPQGAIAESAKATFRDGVLEVSLKAAPAEANRGRRLEIKDGSDGQQKT